jgi:4-hydroxybutyrate CoA-transferase
MTPRKGLTPFCTKESLTLNNRGLAVDAGSPPLCAISAMPRYKSGRADQNKAVYPARAAIKLGSLLKKGENKMDWREIYKSKVVDAVTAFKNLKTGDTVTFSPAAGAPVTLAGGLAERMRQSDIEQITVSQFLTLLPSMGFLAEDIRPKMKFITGYLGGPTRDLVNNGTGEYIPAHLSDWGNLHGSSGINPSVACAQISAPDKNGYCTLGISNMYMPSAIKNAGIVLGEVNKNAPRVHGDTHLHVSEFTHFVETDSPMVTIPKPDFTEVEATIGKYIGEMIHDGDCLQVGIGSLPDAVLATLGDKKDLGVHSETFSDGIMELFQAGVITGKKKNLLPEKIIGTFLMGSRKFYDWIDDNPVIALMKSDFTNNPYIIGQNDNLVSINSALGVDLMGQVMAESVGTQQYSGSGGQVDFVRGARISKGGRTIIAFPATGMSKGQMVSRIVSQLPVGTPVTTDRNDVDYIVTEFGVAKLRFKSLRGRALELINIAHPDFREELKKELQRLKW